MKNLKHTLLIGLAIFFGLSAIVGAQQVVGAYTRYRRQTSTPSTPPTGFTALYFRDSDNHLMSIDSAAATHDYGAVAGTVSTISGPAEMTIANPTTTPAITWTSQAANKFLASPSGGSGAPIMRVLNNLDLTSNTNAVLDTDWFMSPVIEMANGLHTGVYASFANHTCGTRFIATQAMTVTGITAYCPGTSAKTVKLSLWNKAGTRLKNVNISCGSSPSTTTGTFGSSQALTAGQLYYVSGWITDGSLGLGYGVANSDTGIGDSQAGVKFMGSASIMWTGWGADSAGDTFPNGDNSNVMCQFVPVYTVP